MGEVLLLLLPLVIHTVAFLMIDGGLSGLQWLGNLVVEAVRNYD